MFRTLRRFATQVTLHTLALGAPLPLQGGALSVRAIAAPGKLPTHGWFIFWAPHESPRIAGSVFVKRGRGAQEAGKTAARIVKAYFGLV
jgi:hypothetical protein